MTYLWYKQEKWDKALIEECYNLNMEKENNSSNNIVRFNEDGLDININFDFEEETESIKYLV